MELEAKTCSTAQGSLESYEELFPSLSLNCGTAQCSMEGSRAQGLTVQQIIKAGAEGSRHRFTVLVNHSVQSATANHAK